MRDDDGIDRALDIGKNGAGANPEGPKVLAQIILELVEIAPGQTQSTINFGVSEVLAEPELIARGLYQKGGALLELRIAQQAAANAPRLLKGSASTPAEFIKRMRRHAGS